MSSNDEGLDKVILWYWLFQLVAVSTLVIVFSPIWVPLMGLHWALKKLRGLVGGVRS